MDFLTNNWMSWFFSTYSIAIMGAPSVMAFILKLLAMFNPRIPSDKIIDLIKEYWPKDKA